MARTSDVITAERELRNLLALPPAHDRRIIPVTPPTEARLEPDRDSSLSEMLAHQPDVVQQRMLVRVAELRLLVARNQLLPTLGLGALHQLRALGPQADCPEVIPGVPVFKSLFLVATHHEQGTTLASAGECPKGFVTWQAGYVVPFPTCVDRSLVLNARAAQYLLLRTRASYQQVVHQTAHSLARSFLDIESNHKQFQTAARLRQAAPQRLDAQHRYYDEGRITVLRYLDAISEYTTAVATEARYRATYNLAIVGLEEAKGTLLAFEDIAVAEAIRTSDTAAVLPAETDKTRGGPISGMKQPSVPLGSARPAE